MNISSSSNNKRKDPPEVESSEESEKRSFTGRYLITGRESSKEQRIVDALALLDVVYGRVDGNDFLNYFPLPLETYEAGPCIINGQRRYLWTDAFAVMAYQTLAEYYTGIEDLQTADLYSRAVERLIAVVHESLGKPRSSKKSDKMKECEISPTGYVGLRIGKVRVLSELYVVCRLASSNSIECLLFSLL